MNANRVAPRLATVMILLLCGLCRAVEPTAEQVAAMFKEGEAQRYSRIEETRRTIEQATEVLDYARKGKYMRQDTRIGGLYFESDLYADYQSDLDRKRAVESAEAHIASLKAGIAALQNHAEPLIPELRDFLDTGKIGTLPLGASVRTRQAKDQALVVVRLPRSQAFAGQQARDVLAYVKGVDCSADAEVLGRVALPGTFMVTGTSKAGGKEEFLLESVDISQFVASKKREASAIAAPLAKPKASPAKKHLVRGRPVVEVVEMTPDYVTWPPPAARPSDTSPRGSAARPAPRSGSRP